jgi:hypothetical protein
MFPQVPQFLNPVNAVKRVGNYVGNIAREARDVPTAIGTGMWSSFDRQNSRPGYNQTQVNNSISAGRNTNSQIKDVFQAIGGQTGQPRSDQYDNKGNYVSGTKLTK